VYDEDELLPISGIQHLAFCERQWALIYLEGLWKDNLLTAQGRELHQAVDRSQAEARGDVRVARGLRLRSLRLGLVGVADVVEFHRVRAGGGGGVALEGADGLWRPFPVEYKRGKPKLDPCDAVQLCAQALCLEEMLGTPVPRGALFYGLPRRRTGVTFDAELRGRTVRLAQRLHELTARAVTPPPPPGKRCRNCSLRDLCLPRAVRNRSPGLYIRRMLDTIGEDAP